MTGTIKVYNENPFNKKQEKPSHRFSPAFCFAAMVFFKNQGNILKLIKKNGGGTAVNELSVYGVALVPVIMGIIELLKRTGVPNKYSPIIALILGVFSGFYYLAPGEPEKAVFFGIIAGLSAVGLYSGTKNTLQGLNNSSSGSANKNKTNKKKRYLRT